MGHIHAFQGYTPLQVAASRVSWKDRNHRHRYGKEAWELVFGDPETPEQIEMHKWMGIDIVDVAKKVRAWVEFLIPWDEERYDKSSDAFTPLTSEQIHSILGYKTSEDMEVAFKELFPNIYWGRLRVLAIIDERNKQAANKT